MLLPMVQGEKLELQREVHWHEDQRLREWERAEAGLLSGRSADATGPPDWPGEAAAAEGGSAADLHTVPLRRSEQEEPNRDEGVPNDGTDSQGADDGDQELASYAAANRLSKQPGSTFAERPSRQRRIWDEARSNAASQPHAAQPLSPAHWSGAIAEPVRGSGSGADGGARAARSSVSWQLPTEAVEGAGQTKASGISMHGQHRRADCCQHDTQNASGDWARRAEPSSQTWEDRYDQLQEQHDAGTSWRAHEDLMPTRSTSPSWAPSSRAAVSEREGQNRTSTQHGDGMQHDGERYKRVIPSRHLPGKAAAVEHGKADGALRHRGNDDSRTFWRRFAEDDAAAGSAECRTSVLASHERAGLMPSAEREASGDVLLHKATAGTAARWNTARGSGLAEKVCACATSAYPSFRLMQSLNMMAS